MSNIIYYFTGTGNSLQIAKYLKAELEDTQIIRICKKNMQTDNKTDCDRIGFVFPVYYRGLPRMFREFVENLNIQKGNYIFAVVDYGGAAALAFEQLNSLLNNKGNALSAAFEMEMPGNMWFMYYPHPKQVTLDRLATQKERVFSIAKEVQNKSVVTFQNVVEKEKEKEEEVYRQILEISQKDKGFWCDENCIGCGICAKICPAENIVLIKEKPTWKHQCEYCLACLHWCPQKSIQFENITQGKERYHNPSVKVQELFINQ